LVIESGPNRGEYAIVDTMRGAVVLDRDLPVASVEHADPFPAHVRGRDGTNRGTTTVNPTAGTKPAIHFTQLAHGTRKGDYILVRRGEGGDSYHAIEAMRGDVASLDHPSIGGTTSPAVEVSKRTLPPYAGLVVLIGILVGIVFTLIETYAPKNWKTYLP